jgi:hypothetical protein
MKTSPLLVSGSIITSSDSYSQWPSDTVCFLAIIPLEQMFDFLGEQMMFYLGKSLGDLLIITLNKYVYHYHQK